MASSTLRNPQQVKQAAPPKSPDMAKGGGRVTGSSLGTGTGKVVNSTTDKAPGEKSKK